MDITSLGQLGSSGKALPSDTLPERAASLQEPAETMGRAADVFVQSANLESKLKEIYGADPPIDEQISKRREHTGRPVDQGELSTSDKKALERLKAEDTATRAHERAHLAAAGIYARGGANYRYEVGPDGKLYAVGGEVRISTSKVPNDPDATIHKAQTVRRAALAPADPSTQDRMVAALASRMEAEARMEKNRKRTEEAVQQMQETRTQQSVAMASNPQPRPLDEFV